MKFLPVTAAADESALKDEYAGAREIAKLRIGEKNLYVRNFAKVHYLPYADVTRIFRRVQLVSSKMCCGTGDLEIENIVVCTADGEAAQIQMPTTKAAKIALNELRKRAPHARIGTEGISNDTAPNA